MSKHTKGPWTLDQFGQLKDANGKLIEAARISFMTHTSGFDAPEEAVANGRVMAAAPELLEALEMWRDRLRKPGEVDLQVLLHLTDEIIAKATGEAQ